MAILTINVDPETLERAEKKAAEQGTSVDQVVGTYLVAYAARASVEQNGALHSVPTGDDDEARRERIAAFDRLFEMARNSRAGSGPEGRTWTREEIYEDAIMRRK